MDARILIVDDERDYCRMLARHLEMEGHGVLMAHGGIDAVERACRERPDLIILDVNMPDLDGYHACFELKHRANTAGIPIVMLTVEEELARRAKGEMVGADAYIGKSAAIQNLIDTVRDLLQGTDIYN